jgi:hypothetical protein
MCLSYVFHWAGMLTGEHCDLVGFSGGLNLLLRGYVSRNAGGVVLSVGYKINEWISGCVTCALRGGDVFKLGSS